MSVVTPPTIPEITEAVRVLHRRTPLFIAMICFQFAIATWVAFTFTQSRGTTIEVQTLQRQTAELQSAVQALRTQNDDLQKQQQQSTKVFDIFLKSFIDEQNYICYVVTNRAVQNGLKPPAPGVCNVQIPKN